MEWERLLALAAFAFASTWTPGPNNIMLANSGATFGYRASQPHAFGVALGFPIMLFLIALGLGELFKASPVFRETLKWAGAALLLYLAWRIATAGRTKTAGGGRPFTFVEAAGFQWINPKAW
ncbi:MAG: LysE family transporter, partial [Pseudomonadota bacterium]